MEMASKYGISPERAQELIKMQMGGQEQGQDQQMQQIMQQAQRMQRDITKKKEEIDGMEFLGKSEWVEIVFNGKKEIKSFKLLNEGTIEADDKEMLEDMIMIAIKDAFSKIDKESESKLGSYASMSGLF